MGYNIDLSFDILKHGHAKDTALSFATNNGCKYHYDAYEIEQQRSRNHCVMTFNFDKTDCLVGFLKNVKEARGFYIETIYDDESESILYASRFYLTHLMDRNVATTYKLNRRARSYSEDDTLILNAL